ncbi:uncharacterized protein LOC129363031 [Poeciliopsis prolifica]|uniref:uncharacterized protein LOC129363031 n=1 Tax=Poeciliopsis prolifica TaxID=188132 RepID=UPI0024139538|nr:uncharacterized protein LOC129363031 [Poeciliopsis prolifica]
MDLKNNWISKLKGEFSKSPVATTLSFGLIQMVFEKLVEVDFTCPCDSRYNQLHTLPSFIVPPIIVCLLMFAIKCHCKSLGTFDCKSCSKSFCQAVSITFISATIWLIIVFFDGRYYTCAKTSWTGTYETIEKDGPLKWCKPDTDNLNSSKELLDKTEFWYSESQFIGFWMILGLTGLYVFCLLGSRFCCSSDENYGTSRNERNNESSAPV